MEIQTSPRKFIPTEIIVDGKLVDKNIKAYNLDKHWLKYELHKAGLRSYQDVFFAELQSDGNLHIDKKKPEK